MGEVVNIEVENEKSTKKEKADIETLADNAVVELEVENDQIPDVIDKSSKITKKDRISEKHIQKLEMALKKCSKKIKEYEEKEVDWDNETEEDSNYVMTAKLKQRYMEIYSKIAEAKSMSDSLDRKQDRKLRCNESRYPN